MQKDLAIRYMIEKARLATWFNVRPTTHSLTMLQQLAEAELVLKKIQAGPFGTESAFTVPNLNIFIQLAKQALTSKDPYALPASSLAASYLLAGSTDTRSETYVSNLAAATGTPLFALQCSLLRHLVQIGLGDGS